MGLNRGTSGTVSSGTSANTANQNRTGTTNINYLDPGYINQQRNAYSDQLRQNQYQRNLLFGGPGYGFAQGTTTPYRAPVTTPNAPPAAQHPQNAQTIDPRFRQLLEMLSRQSPARTQPPPPAYGEPPAWRTGPGGVNDLGGTSGDQAPPGTLPPSGVGATGNTSSVQPRPHTGHDTSGGTYSGAAGGSPSPGGTQYMRAGGGGFGTSDGDTSFLADPYAGDPTGGNGGAGNGYPVNPGGSSIGGSPPPPHPHEYGEAVDANGTTPASSYATTGTHVRQALPNSTVGNTAAVQASPRRQALPQGQVGNTYPVQPRPHPTTTGQGTGSTTTPGQDYSYTPGAQTGQPTGGVYGFLDSLLHSTGYDDATKTAIGNQGMLSARANESANRELMNRRLAATGNSAGFYGAQAELGRNTQRTLGDQARQNEIDFANEQERRQELGGAGMQNLLGQNMQENLALMSGANSLAQLRGGESETGMTSGTNSGTTGNVSNSYNDHGLFDDLASAGAGDFLKSILDKIKPSTSTPGGGTTAGTPPGQQPTRPGTKTWAQMFPDYPPQQIQQLEDIFGSEYPPQEIEQLDTFGQDNPNDVPYVPGGDVSTSEGYGGITPEEIADMIDQGLLTEDQGYDLMGGGY